MKSLSSHATAWQLTKHHWSNAVMVIAWNGCIEARDLGSDCRYATKATKHKKYTIQRPLPIKTDTTGGSTSVNVAIRAKKSAAER